MKVVHISSMDGSGAGKAAYRLHKGLQSLGVDSHMRVMCKGTTDESVEELPSVVSGRPKAWWRFLTSGWNARLADYPLRSLDNELFSVFSSAIQWDLVEPDLLDADIINLHWVAGLFDASIMPSLLNGKKIVWTLHDMNPFTGGCHYAEDCVQYHQACGICPQLSSRCEPDLSRAGWLRKSEAYRYLDLTVVTPSRWLGGCSSGSGLLGRFRHEIIPYGFPLDIYKPADRQRIRAALNIPPEAKVVLFCASSVAHKRKGFRYLLKSLDFLSQSGKGSNIVLAVIGSGDPKQQTANGYPVMHFGSIGDERHMAQVYNAADVFVLPSLQDNLPNTVVESLACGTPVAAFSIGGVPDMVEQGRTGSLAPGKDIHGLAEAIDWCLHRSPTDIRQSCRSKAEKCFSLSTQARNYSNLYNSLHSLISTRTHLSESKRSPVNSPIRISFSTTSPGHPIEAARRAESRSVHTPGLNWATDLKPPTFEGASTPSGIRIIGETDPDRLRLDHLETLHRMRSALAELWLNIPDAELSRRYAAEEGKIHREIAIGPLKDAALSSVDRKRAFALVDMVEKQGVGPHLVRYLLAAMLYFQAYELPGVHVVSLLPEWFQQDYLRFLLELPRGFQSKGIVDGWCGCLEKVMDQIHEGIRREPHAHLWQKLAFVFTEKVKLMPFYFTRKDLKRIFELRASIVEFALSHRRYSLNHSFSNRPAGRKRLRLGIYCRAFAPYTETFATLPLFMHIDRSVFEVHLYVSRSDGNPFETYVRRWCDTYTLLPEPIKESVQRIREDELDILFFGNNLTAVSGPAFLLANHRLARVQGIHFCSPATSGQRHIDFFLLGDHFSGKFGERSEGFSEIVLTIEGSGICFDLPVLHSSTEAARARADYGISEQSRLFISGANYFKITPELRRLWARIISRVPGSVLFLYPFGPAWANDYPKKLFVDNFRAVLVEHGVDPSRLIVVDTLPGQEAILALNRIADVYLDAVPYNGATSLLDPLRAGIPVVVADGGELRFAQGAAMLRELGVPELVAADEEEYVHLAVRLGNDDAQRHVMRERIRDRMRRTPDFLNPRLYGQRVSQALLSLFPELHRGTGLKAATPEDSKVARASVSL